MKALMPTEQFAAWQRQQEESKQFWRTLNGPAQRPLGANADEWLLFLEENKDALPFLAVQIAEAIGAATVIKNDNQEQR
jgi:predicted alpha/beta hydrolase family esterase